MVRRAKWKIRKKFWSFLRRDNRHGRKTGWLSGCADNQDSAISILKNVEPKLTSIADYDIEFIAILIVPYQAFRLG
jgi:hypothetical protein